MSAYTEVLKDPTLVQLWLMEAEARNLDTGEDVVLYFSNRSYGTQSGDSLPNQRFDACILGGLKYSGAISPPTGPVYGILEPRRSGEIVLAHNLGVFDTGALDQLNGYPLSRFSFGGRRCIVRHGGYTRLYGGGLLPYDDMGTTYLEFDGEPLIGESEVTFKLRGRDDRFQYPIQPRTYYGCKGAVRLDEASSQYVDCGTNSVFNFTSSDFTAEFLIYLTAYPTNNTSVMMRGRVNISGWNISISNTGVVALETYQAGATQTTTSNVIPLHQWYRVSAVRAGTTAYIYGQGLDITDSHGTHINPTSVSRTLYFGYTDSTSNFAHGFISDLRLWSKALTSAEVNTYKHRPLDSSEYTLTGLVGYWPVDDVTGSTISQKVAATTGSDGTLTGGAAIVVSLMGGDELQGSPLPDTWGYVKGWKPVLVDTATMLYQVHSGSIEEFERVDIGGYGATELGNSYTDLMDFLDPSAPTADGTHDICITPGGSFFRFGNVPGHPVSVDVKGDNTGGTFRYTVADIVRFILCNRGWFPLVDPDDLDTSSFSDLNTANSADVGIAYADDRSVSDVLTSLLQTVGAVGWFRSSDDLFSVQVFGSEGATPTIYLSENDVSEEGVTVVDLGPPVHRVGAKYRRNYVVMGTADMLEGVASSDRGRFIRREWRRADVSDALTKENYKDACNIVYETCFDKWHHAIAESNRQLQMLKVRGTVLRFTCKGRGLGLDRMDKVYFNYKDRDEFSQEQNRFLTEESSVFIVLEASDDPEFGCIILTLWKAEEF